ncbi:hypothetical protein HG530_004173 [Fusarium avenaceum]|nr:hypothetical protein HG530_004173 [Fusarium avenaceum]
MPPKGFRGTSCSWTDGAGPVCRRLSITAEVIFSRYSRLLEFSILDERTFSSKSVFVVRQSSFHLLANKNTGLKSPSTCDVSHCVATSTENQSRKVEALDKVDTVGMTIHAQVEATETITRQTVATTLQDNSLRLVVLHDVLNNRLEDRTVRRIGNTISERKVDGVVLSLSNTSIPKLTSSREILAILVERNGHDTVGGVESLLNTVTMMDIDINVEDPLFKSKEFENAEDDV